MMNFLYGEVEGKGFNCGFAVRSQEAGESRHFSLRLSAH